MQPSPPPRADVLVPLLEQLPAPFSDCAPPAVAGVEDDYAAALAAIPDGRAEDQGVQLGRAAAATILAVRTGDGADTPLFDTAYPQGTVPGAYRFTPGFAFAFAPGWADVTPFVLRDSSQFRAGPPHEVHHPEVRRGPRRGQASRRRRHHHAQRTHRRADRDRPVLGRELAAAVEPDRPERLREGSIHGRRRALFGLLNMALADGYVGSFETKYLYNYWRPVTAIREAATDGNPNTSADPTWTPLVPTPPIPDHDSAHSVQGGAAAEVLRRVFGTDHIGFRTCSLTLPSGSTCADPSPVTRWIPGRAYGRRHRDTPAVGAGASAPAAGRRGAAGGDRGPPGVPDPGEARR